MERTRYISDLKQIAEISRREAALKGAFGFQASEGAVRLDAAFGRIWPQAKVLSQAVLEARFRGMLGLSIPSAARSEELVAEEDAKGLTVLAQAARQIVLSTGKSSDLNEPELYVVTPEDEKGVQYTGIATEDGGDVFFTIYVKNPTPEFRSITCRFKQEGELFELEMEPTDRRTGIYYTPFKPVTEMAANEYRIIKHSGENFLERSGFIKSPSGR